MMRCRFPRKFFRHTHNTHSNEQEKKHNAKKRNVYAYNSFLSKVNKHTQTPVNAVWFVVVFSIALNCIAIGSTQTATAIFSITAPALDLSYVSVIFAHQFYRDKVRFIEGPFTLGRWGRPINLVSITWVVFISAVLFFPPTVPITVTNMWVFHYLTSFYFCCRFYVVRIYADQWTFLLGIMVSAWVLSLPLLPWFGGGFLLVGTFPYMMPSLSSSMQQLLTISVVNTQAHEQMITPRWLGIITGL